MRAIMRGLTEAEFERLYGLEEQCLAAWVKARQDACAATNRMEEGVDLDGRRRGRPEVGRSPPVG
jgi:hypothetical protein